MYVGRLVVTVKTRSVHILRRYLSAPATFLGRLSSFLIITLDGCFHHPRTLPPRQTDVQQLISQQHEEVWALLRHPKCHVYVCGDSSLGEETTAEVCGRSRCFP